MAFARVSNGVLCETASMFPGIYANAAVAANAGWLPYTDNPPSFNPDKQYLVSGNAVITANSASSTYTVANYTATQLAANLANAKANAYATLSTLRANAVTTMTYQGQRVRCDDKAIHRACSQHYVMTQSASNQQSVLTGGFTMAAANSSIAFQINPGIFITANSNVLWSYIQAASVHNQANWTYKAQQAALVNACTTPSAVNAVIANATGWTY